MTPAGVSPLLEAEDVVVRFGGLRALDGVSLSVPESGIVGLIGPNGAGKTTFIDAVTGFVPLASGSIRFAGSTITGRSAHQRARRGLTRTFQSLELFEDLTVQENVMLPTESGTDLVRGRARFRSAAREARASVSRALEQFALHDVARTFPGQLSQAQRKYLALARAIVVKPRLLLLDEPAAGLDQAGTEELGGRLRQLARSGMALLLVDHDMALVLDVCDRIFVLDAGQVLAAGTPREIRTDPKVLRSYLGEEVPAGASPEAGS